MPWSTNYMALFEISAIQGEGGTVFARIQTAAIVGIEAVPVGVEVEIRSSTRQVVTILGLGDSAIREAKGRIESAIRSSGCAFPRDVLINLAPADVKKEGSGFDLPMALGVLVASRQIPAHGTESVGFLGELGLDGEIKPVRGAISVALAARERGFRGLVVSRRNAKEAGLVQGLEVYVANTLSELIAALTRDGLAQLRFLPETEDAKRPVNLTRLSDVQGQERAKRALIVAMSGGHNLLLIGPPGCGKSMLADRARNLLPPLSGAEKQTVMRIHSAVGLPVDGFLDGHRPFRQPHHLASDVGLIGGGAPPRPGEISLAHHGVLFLDEFPEFRRSGLEALRAPLETGFVTISRAQGSVRFPARFQLVAAMNPCPCGRLGVPNARCLCSPQALISYLRKLSEPILDRIDLHCELEPVPLEALTKPVQTGVEVSDESVQELVLVTRDRQMKRQGELNATMTMRGLIQSERVPTAVTQLLHRAAEKLGLSARGYVRVLRVARTIADIEGVECMKTEHVAEALSYRRLERYSQLARAA